jgi:hypothetical protein
MRFHKSAGFNLKYVMGFGPVGVCFQHTNQTLAGEPEEPKSPVVSTERCTAKRRRKGERSREEKG